jgi:hypothetical protein
MANEILSEIRLELDKFRADLKEAQKAGEDTGRKAGEDMGGGIETGLSKMFGGIKGKFIALAGTIAGAFTLKESIAAAMEQENAINALNSSMAITGTYSAQATKSFQDFASALQKTTTATDESITQGGALLVTMGRLSGDTLQRATQASLDLAAALNIDQASAFNMVAKAASGHVNVLNRYGIEVKRTGDETKDFGNALTELETRFKGLAQLQTNTFAGALSVTKNQFGEVLEAIGNIVIKSPTMIAILKSAASMFENLAATITDFTKNRDLINEIGKSLVQFGQGVNTYLVAPLELGFNLLRTGALTIATAFSGLISILGLVGAAINNYLIGPIVNFITGGLGKLIALVDKDLAASLNDFVAQSTESITQGLQIVGDAAAQETARLAENTADAAGKTFDFDVANASDNYLQKADQFFANVTPAMVGKFQELSDTVKANSKPPSFFGEFAKGFDGATKSMGDSAKALGAQIFNTIAVGVTNAFAAMGAAMVKGENGMKAFGMALLGVLGDIAIQFGSVFIAMGIAKTLLFDPTGPLLIAAGGVLAVIGGALKAFAGGGAGGPSTSTASAGGGGGGGVAAGGGTGEAPQQSQALTFNDTQRGQVGTKVEVNVQGNVFDRRETGLMIADTINEAFGSNGITFATGAKA